MIKMSEAISPKIDCVFKSIFGVRENSDILADFLDSVVDFQPGELKQIYFLDPELSKENAADKGSVLDVRVLTAEKTIIDIEIQLAYQKAMPERSLYYWAKMFSGQIESGKKYRELQRTICINILDFNLFETKNYHTSFGLRERKEGFLLTDKLQIDFLELKKAKKAASQGKTGKLLDWLRFIDSRSDNKEVLQMLAEKSEPMQKAVGVLLHLSEDEKERRRALQREMFLHDQAELRDEGREEGQKELIRKMNLSGISIPQIAKISGRSEEEIQKILK